MTVGLQGGRTGGGAEPDASVVSQLLMAVNRGMEVLARAGFDAVALERVADQAFEGLPLTSRARVQRASR